MADRLPDDRGGRRCDPRALPARQVVGPLAPAVGNTTPAGPSVFGHSAFWDTGADWSSPADSSRIPPGVHDPWNPAGQPALGPAPTCRPPAPPLQEDLPLPTGPAALPRIVHPPTLAQQQILLGDAPPAAELLPSTQLRVPPHLRRPVQAEELQPAQVMPLPRRESADRTLPVPESSPYPQRAAEAWPHQAQSSVPLRSLSDDGVQAELSILVAQGLAQERSLMRRLMLQQRILRILEAVRLNPDLELTWQTIVTEVESAMIVDQRAQANIDKYFL